MQIRRIGKVLLALRRSLRSMRILPYRPPRPAKGGQVGDAHRWLRPNGRQESEGCGSPALDRSGSQHLENGKYAAMQSESLISSAWLPPPFLAAGTPQSSSFIAYPPWVCKPISSRRFQWMAALLSDGRFAPPALQPLQSIHRYRRVAQLVRALT